MMLSNPLKEQHLSSFTIWRTMCPVKHVRGAGGHLSEGASTQPLNGHNFLCDLGVCVRFINTNSTRVVLLSLLTWAALSKGCRLSLHISTHVAGMNADRNLNVHRHPELGTKKYAYTFRGIFLNWRYAFSGAMLPFKSKGVVPLTWMRARST